MCRKCAPKASARLLFNFGKKTKKAIACKNLFLKQDILKKDYQKTLKKFTLFFLLNPVPFDGQNYEKQKRPGTSDQSLSRLQSKFRKIPELVMYYLAKFHDVR